MTLKQGILCTGLFFLSSVCQITASALELGDNNEISTSRNPAASKADAYILQVYNNIKFTDAKLDVEIFNKAMKGYLNLRSAGKLGSNQDILTIADMSLSSNKSRLWIIKLSTGKVLYHTYVAHGQGTGDEFATAFSNRDNSHQSSLGFYVTGEIYQGEHGTSLRLDGMDKGYNHSALQRGIVVHGADYVSSKFIAGNQRLGRSWGCPAVESKLAPAIINTIKNGSCLFVYAAQNKYFADSYWLNKRIESVPVAGANSMLVHSGVTAEEGAKSNTESTSPTPTEAEPITKVSSTQDIYVADDSRFDASVYKKNNRK